MNKKNISTKALSGFMELLPSEQMAFNGMLDIIRESYEVSGFIPLDTPAIERAETLFAKAGGETEKQIYRFKRGDRDLALRFDLTVPLARYVVEHYNDLVFPFRRYAISKVYRGERAQAGRFREFYQCDIDIIGDGELSSRYDAEVPFIMYTIFKKLGFEKFTIRINNRGIFDGLFKYLNIAKDSTKIMQTIDKLEKIGQKAVEQELKNLGLPKDTIDKIFVFLSFDGSTDDILEKLKNFEIDNTEFVTGVRDLEEVIELIRQFGVPESNFKIDLTIARGLAYYTGTVYETQLDEYSEFGSVCSGGRYDNLASAYTDRELPGVGMSIGLTRLFDQMRKKGLINLDNSTPTKVLIVPMTEELETGLSLAKTLRENGIATEVSFVEGKMKKRLRYADKLGIEWVIFIGEDEIAKNVYTLKNLTTGEQTELDLKSLLSQLLQ